jgi:hypothetical protein
MRFADSRDLTAKRRDLEEAIRAACKLNER